MSGDYLGIWEVRYVTRYAGVKAERTLRVIAGGGEAAIARVKEHVKASHETWVALVKVRLIKRAEL